jgi:intraflagellar transport protein 140
MKFARGAKALREVKRDGGDADARLATVAIQLNMIDVAEELLIASNRYDLLNELYQNMNKWDKAIELAEQNDKINLKATYYKAANNYELQKQWKLAIEYYEKSDTNLEEIPRMLYDNSMFTELEEYVLAKDEKELWQFFAKFKESRGEIDEAQKYYQKANDNGSIVRINISLGNTEAAEFVCNNTEDCMGCFWLAQHYETEQALAKALVYYKKGQHFHHAMRLAKEVGADDEVYAAAIQAPSYVQLRAAKYFEGKKLHQNAVVLYMKGKSLKKALDLAMRYKLDEYITQITSLIDKEKTDHTSMDKLGDQLADMGQHSKAFAMFIGSNQISKAIALLQEQNIELTDDLVKYPSQKLKIF